MCPGLYRFNLMITLYKEYVIDTEEDVITSELFTNSNTLNQRLIYKNFRLGSFYTIT